MHVDNRVELCLEWYLTVRKAQDCALQILVALGEDALLGVSVVDFGCARAL